MGQGKRYENDLSSLSLRVNSNGSVQAHFAPFPKLFLEESVWKQADSAQWPKGHPVRSQLPLLWMFDFSKFPSGLFHAGSVSFEVREGKLLSVSARKRRSLFGPSTRKEPNQTIGLEAEKEL